MTRFKDFSYKSIANTIRGLSMDAIQKANSGHPGLPLGLADVAAVLWSDFVRFNPANPDWFNRDRFVLSGGHGSMLLYSLLHLYGFDLSLEEIRQFRQMDSKTPGHPEFGHTPGVETTTGPLGQGLANAVGMAIAEAQLAARYNKQLPVIDHYTYVMAGDGDLQEGISHEVCSLAGHLKLGKLILLFDSNDITIDGRTELSFSEDVASRFSSYGWEVFEADGYDHEGIREVIEKARSQKEKPSLIIFRTIIGYGSPNKAGTSGVHGSPLGKEERDLAKKELGIPVEEEFHIPESLSQLKNVARDFGMHLETSWLEMMSQFADTTPKLHEQLIEDMAGQFSDYLHHLPWFEAGGSMATRKASGTILSHLVDSIHGLMGGSADLTPSNNTKTANHRVFDAINREGNYIHYGIREHGMAAIMNGIALHGGLVPYGGTFFVFSDYMRPAIRMAALMGIRVIHVHTHDSIGLGEDGPTHQPVEHLTSLRAMPNIQVLRPMDANETVLAWKMALEKINGPSILVLTRQNLPVLDPNLFPVRNAEKGGYVLTEDEGFDRLVIASGSEVHLALQAKKILNEKGIRIRIVSMMCTEIFDRQNDTYRDSVLPPGIKIRLAVEAGATLGWYKYVGSEGKIIGMDSFGASAPDNELFEKFGITSNAIVSALE